MAARLNPRHTELARQKIQASCLIDRLHKIALGEIEATSQQIQAATALLDRSVPKLSQIQHVGDSENPINMSLKVEFINGSVT